MTVRNSLRVLKSAWRSIDKDQAFMAEIGGRGFSRRNSLRAVLLSPSIRAAFWFRVASSDSARALQIFARARLIHGYGCDVAVGATFDGALYLPHPIGVVVGKGATVGDRVQLFQNVTIGAGRNSLYPTIGDSAILLPFSIIVGGVEIGKGARVGAGSFVDCDVPPGKTFYGDSRQAVRDSTSWRPGSDEDR